MKPIFTIHAGEYLVAAEIEKNLKNTNVWIPSIDTGIDLLLTDKQNKSTVSLQVKFSKDFNPTHLKENLRPHIKGSGWWTLNRKKIEDSQADFWVFVLYSFQKKTNDYIIIEPKQLLSLFDSLQRMGNPHVYLTVTEKNKAFETRGLNKNEMLAVCNETYHNDKRDLTNYLNNWDSITSLLNVKL